MVEPGDFSVMIGSSSEDIRLTGEFTAAAGYKLGSERVYFSQVEIN